MSDKRKRVLVPQTEATIISEVASGASPSRAVKAAGMTMNKRNSEVFVEHVKRKVASPHGAMTQALVEVGVDMTTIATTLKEGLEATTFVKMGALAPPLEVADHSVRHRFMESALDIMGGRAPTKQIVEQIKTHEETVAVVEGVRANPELLVLIKQRLESRMTKEITTEVVVDEG